MRPFQLQRVVQKESLDCIKWRGKNFHNYILCSGHDSCVLLVLFGKPTKKIITSQVQFWSYNPVIFMLLPILILKSFVLGKIYLVHHHKAALEFELHIGAIKGSFGTKNVLLIYCFVLCKLVQLKSRWKVFCKGNLR